MEKFSSEELKGMLKDEAISTAHGGAKFGQDSLGRLTVDGSVVPYQELKQRDDAWYEARAEFWMISELLGGTAGVGIWNRDKAPLNSWHGCYVKKSQKVIYFEPFNVSDISLYEMKSAVSNWLAKFHPEFSRSVPFCSHSSRDIREAIDADGPWVDENEKLGTDGDSACGGPKGPPGPIGDAKPETVNPKTIDAIVAMYEDKILAITAQYELGIRESHLIIQSQRDTVLDLTSKLARIRDAIDGKPALASTQNIDSAPVDPFDTGHQQAVEDAAQFHCAVFPTGAEIQKEMEQFKPQPCDGNF